jgi:hypothetical protein
LYDTPIVDTVDMFPVDMILPFLVYFSVDTVPIVDMFGDIHGIVHD